MRGASIQGQGTGRERDLDRVTIASSELEHQDFGSVPRQALPTIDTGTFVSLDVANDRHPGDLIGPYRLIRLLGEGGMAEVWLAQRADGSIKREVALKLPMLWRDREDLPGRFSRECDILAALEHPHIARLYDAGISPEGLPYLAMEYVRGEKLIAWCDAHRAGVRERLRLVLQVLDALQYAHAHQVIHRDIKPSNILVNEAGQVRLLDFGVSKLLAQEEQPPLTVMYWACHDSGIRKSGAGARRSGRTGERRVFAWGAAVRAADRLPSLRHQAHGFGGAARAGDRCREVTRPSAHLAAAGGARGVNDAG